MSDVPFSQTTYTSQTTGTTTTTTTASNAQQNEKDAVLFLIDTHASMFRSIKLGKDSKVDEKVPGMKQEVKESIKAEQEIASQATSMKESLSEGKSSLESAHVKESMTQSISQSLPQRVDKSSQGAKKLKKLEKLEDSIPFYAALKCTADFYAHKIITNSSDKLAVMFFGTEAKKNPHDFDSIYLSHEFDMPDAFTIKQLESMYKGNDPLNLGHLDPPQHCNFYNVLWACQHLFAPINKEKFGYKRIFLFTSTDDPTFNDPAIKKKCLSRLQDLNDSGIKFELLLLKSKNQPFNVNKFWGEIIDVDSIELHVLESFEAQRKKVQSKEYSKRAVASFPLTIAENIEFGVSLYNIIQPAQKGASERLHATTNTPIRAETKTICQDTGLELLEGDITYYFEYGGEKVFFSKDDLNSIKQISSKGLKILGFKPISALKQHHQFRSAGFLYPDDKLYSGSTIAFSALLQKLLEKQQMAIGRFKPRDTSSPIYVALLPQEEEIEDDEQIQAPGFHIIYLPFADSIRGYMLEEGNITVEENQKKACKEMIQKLLLPSYDPQMFSNPTLIKHYSVLQSLALERSLDEEIQDTTLPQQEAFDKYQDYITQFKETVYDESYSVAKPTKKRSRSDQKPLKKRKMNEGPTEDELNIPDLAKNEELYTLTVKQLKEYCKKNKIKQGRNKTEIIENINTFLKK